MKRTIVLLVVVVVLIPSVCYSLHVETVPAITERLKVNEGLRLTPYTDPSGDHMCIGYGHNTNFPICKEAAEIQLKHDVELAISYLRTNFISSFDDFPLEKQIALIEMMFCLGPNSFSRFKRIISAIHRGDWNIAGVEVLTSDWAKTYRTRAGNIAKDLMYGSELKYDTEQSISYLRTTFSDFNSFPLEKQIALIDMVSHIGPESFETFKRVISAVLCKDWNTAGAEVLKSNWAREYPIRAKQISKDLMGTQPGKRKVSK
jgi:GH24 family phage-related lysozyme (muramidase)